MIIINKKKMIKNKMTAFQMMIKYNKKYKTLIKQKMYKLD